MNVARVNHDRITVILHLCVNPLGYTPHVRVRTVHILNNMMSRFVRGGGGDVDVLLK